MTTKSTMDFRDFNRQCQDLGLDPYPLEEVQFNFQDRDHFLLSVKNWQDSLERWFKEQEDR